MTSEAIAKEAQEIAKSIAVSMGNLNNRGLGIDAAVLALASHIAAHSSDSGVASNILKAVSELIAHVTYLEGNGFGKTIRDLAANAPDAKDVRI